MLERLGQVLLAEWQLADRPDLRIRLQLFLQLRVEAPGLHSDDGRGGVGVVSNGRAALGAEDAVDGFARASHSGPALGGALDRKLVFEDHGDEGVGGAGLALAVVAMVVADEEGLVHVDCEGDGLTEAMSGERHFVERGCIEVGGGEAASEVLAVDPVVLRMLY
jgi:hypothetical protein